MVENAPVLQFQDRVGWQRYPELGVFDATFFEKLLLRAWKFFDGPASAHLDIVWMDGEEHDRLHASALDDPTPTDVITFPYGDPDLFGEIVVNLDMAKEQATSRDIAMLDEVALYVVHGALHLLGLDDATEEQRRAMRAAEAKVLARES
ncbi:MAG: rRNA maturation RNase YbeY [Planctomycetota bacterium]